MEKEQKQLYLPEDQDLLNGIEKIKVGQDVFEVRAEKLTEIQIKSTLRSRKTYHDMDKATSKFSLILIFIGVLQIVLALLQYTLNVYVAYPTGWRGLVPMGFLIGVIYFMVIRPFQKIMKEQGMISKN